MSTASIPPLDVVVVKRAQGPFPRRRWLMAAMTVIVVGLAISTWWLLTDRTRGVEIATVLALPVAVLSTVAAIVAAVVTMRR